MFIPLGAQEIISSFPDSISTDRPLFRNSLFKPFIEKIFVVEKNFNDTTGVHSYMNIDYFKQFKGLKVRKIRIKIIQPFSVNQEDPGIYRGSKKALNYFHAETRKFVVVNHLLFKEGDYIDPYLFAESERFLRKNNYIFDAGILIEEDLANNEADIFVYIQDVWNVQVSGSYNNDFTKGNTQIKDINLLGMGGSLTLNLKKDPEYNKEYKPDFEYKYSRLFDKFGIGRIYYNSDSEGIKSGFGANQEYVQSWLKVLGGINSDWTRLNSSSAIEDTIIVDNGMSFNENDLWMGYNFSLDVNDNSYLKYRNMIVAARIADKKYSKRPLINEHYQDNYTLLGSVCFLARYFYQDNYIFAFGKTEDIPVGKKMELSFGKEYGEFDNRLYFSVNSTYAKFSPKYGYFLNNIRFGTYLKDREFDYGILDLQTYYFTRLCYLYNCKSRHYLTLRYSRSLNPYDKAHLLSLNTDNAINGFESSFNKGDKRFICKIEHDIFTPFTIAGFSTAVIQFTDLGLLSARGQSIINNPLKSAIGVGFRFKNEHLVFSTIQFTIAYYPNATLDEMESMKYFTERQSYSQFDKMNYNKPSVLGW